MSSKTPGLVCRRMESVTPVTGPTGAIVPACAEPTTLPTQTRSPRPPRTIHVGFIFHPSLVDMRQQTGQVALEDAVLEELRDHHVLDRDPVHEVGGSPDVSDVDGPARVGVEELHDDEIPGRCRLTREAEAGPVRRTGADEAFAGVEYLAQNRGEQGKVDRGATADGALDGAQGSRLEVAIQDVEVARRNIRQPGRGGRLRDQVERLQRHRVLDGDLVTRGEGERAGFLDAPPDARMARLPAGTTARLLESQIPDEAYVGEIGLVLPWVRDPLAQIHDPREGPRHVAD